MLGESTVFLIRLDPSHADEFIIEPRCVVNIATFAVQFNRQFGDGMTTYSSDWSERMMANFSEQELTEWKLVGDAPVTLAMAASSSIDDVLKDLAANTTNEFHPVKGVSTQLIDPLILSRLQDRVEKSFALDPAGASRKLIQKVMEFLPPAIKAQPQSVQSAKDAG